MSDLVVVEIEDLEPLPTRRPMERSGTVCSLHSYLIIVCIRRTSDIWVNEMYIGQLLAWDET